MEIGLDYQLNMDISGGANNDIGLVLPDPDSNSVIRRTISDSFTSPRYGAAENDFYTFEFSNQSMAVSSMLISKSAAVGSVSGVLVISH